MGGRRDGIRDNSEVLMFQPKLIQAFMSPWREVTKIRQGKGFDRTVLENLVLDLCCGWVASIFSWYTTFGHFDQLYYSLESCEICDRKWCKKRNKSDVQGGNASVWIHMPLLSFSGLPVSIFSSFLHFHYQCSICSYAGLCSSLLNPTTLSPQSLTPLISSRFGEMPPQGMHMASQEAAKGAEWPKLECKVVNTL